VSVGSTSAFTMIRHSSRSRYRSAGRVRFNVNTWRETCQNLADECDALWGRDRIMLIAPVTQARLSPGAQLGRVVASRSDPELALSCESRETVSGCLTDLFRRDSIFSVRHRGLYPS